MLGGMLVQVSICAAVLVFSQLPAGAGASAFLGRAGGEALALEPPAARQEAILNSLEKALGQSQRQAMEARVGSIVEDLRTMFEALPKNERGALRAPAARYAMHRLFVQRHGWQVRGLDPAGQGWAASSPALALGDRVPGHVRDLFDERLAGRGLDLHELAVLAATLEQLIHGEALGRLGESYAALGRAPGEPLGAAEATEVIETYMVSYLLGRNTSALSREQVLRQNLAMRRAYPGWPETRGFLREVQKEVAGNLGSLAFQDVTRVVEEVGERYGRFQGRECLDLKGRLAGLERVSGTGRVRLSDFYGSIANSGSWQFSESADYLRQIGALDESDPSQLAVIIPNYLNGPSNCVASSGYYAVCCIDECEGLMRQLEQEIGAPSTSPEVVARAVASLPSPSVPANRTLPPALLRKLEVVAAQNGGSVPLHGRLFARWLHHAYPRECPYPHAVGTTKPMSMKEWKQATGLNSTITREELASLVGPPGESRDVEREVQERGAEGSLCSAMWSSDEELLDPEAHTAHAAGQSHGASTTLARPPTASAPRAPLLRCLPLVAALAAASVAGAQLLSPALRAVAATRRSDKPPQVVSV